MAPSNGWSEEALWCQQCNWCSIKCWRNIQSQTENGREWPGMTRNSWKWPGMAGEGRGWSTDFMSPQQTLCEGSKARIFYKEVNLCLKVILRSFPWRTKSLFIDLANIKFCEIQKNINLWRKVDLKFLLNHVLHKTALFMPHFHLCPLLPHFELHI